MYEFGREKNKRLNVQESSRACERVTEREGQKNPWGLLIFFKRDRSRQESEERDGKEIKIKLKLKLKRKFVLLQLISMSTKFNG